MKMPRPTSASRLLDTWEQGLGQPQALQALAFLQWARPDAERAALERLTIGQRNAELLALRSVCQMLLAMASAMPPPNTMATPYSQP